MNVATAMRRFELHLRRRGLRVTEPRRSILELAWSTHRHFTAEDLFRWARERDARASRATVYRTLALMVEGGFLAPLDGGRGQMLYEHILGHHHHDHMICLECGRIIEFRCDAIEKLQEEQARKHRFQLAGHSLTLEGYCAGCTRQQAGAPETDEAQAASP